MTTILTNATIVLPDQLLHGTITFDHGAIADIQPGPSHAPAAIDCEGDTIIPGVVDVHTDNLERQVQPRSNARWPSRSAMVAHDAQCAAAGVTTVLDALCLGDLGFSEGRTQTFLDGVQDLDALADTGLLKAQHFLHLRCELPAPEMLALFEPVAHHPRVHMVSLMDHSPGFGQYTDIERYRAMRIKGGTAPAEVDRRIAHLAETRSRTRPGNRNRLLALMQGRPVILASHDDNTEAEIQENFDDGIRLAEFPVSLTAARAAKARGMGVIAGAPNIVRGGSHSGNVSAAQLVREGVADAYASDYVPSSLVEAAFATVEAAAITLPQAVAMVTAHPAAMAGLPDRGALRPGLRADLVRLRLLPTPGAPLPITRQVWRAGERVI